jgi:hypothetical protein
VAARVGCGLGGGDDGTVARASGAGVGVLRVRVGGGASDMVVSDGAGVETALRTRLTVSLSARGYSLTSLASARAFPFNKSRWAATGGPFGCSAKRCLTARMESVGWTDTVKLAGGLRDFKVRVRVEAEVEPALTCRGTPRRTCSTGTFLSEFSGGCW